MTPLDTLHNLIPMNPASLSFVYVLLPIYLLAYYLVPLRFRPAVLLASAIGSYMLAQPEHMLLCSAVAITGYGFVCAIGMLRERLFWRKALMCFCAAFNLGVAAYFSLTAPEAEPPPLGLLIVCVSVIDAALEACRKDSPRRCGMICYAVYVMFFPRLYAGPLVGPREFYESAVNAKTDRATVLTGFGRFAEGLLKYAAIGRSLFLFYESIRSIPDSETSVLSSWMLVLSFALALYFTLSGLADIARGIAGMFGISMPQNFYYPYQARSVSDFFERFNMSVTAFLRRAGAAPLSASFGNPVMYSARLLLAAMLWGVWFGVRTSYLVWGVFIGFFMIMEKYLYPRALNVLPTLFCRCYTFLAVLLGFTLFTADGAAQCLASLSGMLGLGGIDVFNRRILYILSMNWVLLLLSAVLATNTVSLIISAAHQAFPKASLVFFTVIDVCVLILFTSLTLGGGVL